VNIEIEAARNIVGQQAFVNAIIHIAIEEKRGEAIGAKLALGALKRVPAIP
jgi:hypothetical protein